MLTLFLTLNTFFSLLYMMDPHGIANAKPGNFWDTFLFSVGTIATANYTNLAPRSVYANGVFVLQAFLDYMYLGFVTSMMFARYSRPWTARSRACSTTCSGAGASTTPRARTGARAFATSSPRRRR